MSVRIVVGAQWGDEGKGKIVDLLSREANYVIRYQGGANAGHTIKFDDQEMVLHLIPSGIFHPDSQCIIGNGVVVDPEALTDEIDALKEMEVDLTDRLHVSETAHVILPYHKLLDEAREKMRGEDAIGTTGRGIGPAYVDKVARSGIRMVDLLDKKNLKEKIESNLEEVNATLECIYNEEPLEVDDIYEPLARQSDRLAPFIKNTSHLLHQAVNRGENILLEGAQGSLLDIDHGTYPYVTSSPPTAGGACVGSAIPPTAIDHVMGISKAYCTRVGNGPFPTELENEVGQRLRDKGNEYGATTGRPRRCGWIDLVALRYAAHVNGLTELTITKLDVMDQFDTIKACTSYKIDGEETQVYPLDTRKLERAQPVYTTMEGWNSSTRNCEKLSDLPEEARNYIEYLQDFLDVAVKFVSTGPRRNETVEV